MKKIAKKLRQYIMSLPKEQLFTYADLPIPRLAKVAATQAIYRLVKRGVIKRLKKGTFYRPVHGYGGEARLIDPDIAIAYYLQEKGNKIGYVTGTTTYNALGLTTQHPLVLEVASYRPLAKLEYYGTYLQTKPVKSYIPVTEKNYQYLQFLDLFRFFPIRYLDLNRKSVINYFIDRLKKMSSKVRKQVVTFALSYPPRIRAFLGALLEAGGMHNITRQLMESLNPTSFYKLHARSYYLPTAKKWHLYDDITRKRKAI